MIDSMYRGCLFCRSGKEAEIVQRFQRTFPDSRAIFPTCTRYRHTRDGGIEERVPLLPGYVFFEMPLMQTGVWSVPDESPASRFLAVESALFAFSRTDYVLRLLRYADQDWRLQGSDDAFARALFEAEGNIDTSRAYFDEGRRIRILSGFLKDYEGCVTRVNRRKRTVEVSVDFQGKKVNMLLGYELVVPVQDGEQISESDLTILK